MLTALARTLSDPLIRDDAVTILRNLIARVEIRHDGEGWQVDLQGEITGLIALGMGSESKTPQTGVPAGALSSAKWLRGQDSNLNFKVLSL